MPAVFRPRHGWRVEKSLRQWSGRLDLDLPALSLVTFFEPAKKVTRSLASETPLIFACHALLAFSLSGNSNSKSFRLAAGHFLCLPKESNQRNGSPYQSEPAASLVRGFFDTPSMAWSKNDAHPCASPYGSTIRREYRPKPKANIAPKTKPPIGRLCHRSGRRTSQSA